MHARARRVVASTAGLALSLGVLAFAAPAQAAPAGSPAADQPARADNLPNPFAEKQRAAKLKAMDALAQGKAKKQASGGGGSVVTLADGTTAEFFDNKAGARIWTVLSEFGQASGKYGRVPGPLHNQIPQPDRAVDNTTQWTSDFNRPHYDGIFNGDAESFKRYYVNQSKGAYRPTVTVEDWVKVPYNASYYGNNKVEDKGGSWAFINDTVDAWYNAQKAAGKTDAEIADYLKQFDVWDRYDYDGDGNYNEPDGYIDHFQAIHAGAGEEAGGGAQGDDAIWSHRWYADPTTAGSTGPAGNLLGGQQIGNTGMYIGDYTVEPENGGVGVFAHEYGHDLGLPDFYDTAGGENGTAFWTLMSSGSWMGHGDEATGFDVGIGGTPNDMGPEEKLFLGWLDVTDVAAGSSAQVTLAGTGAAASNQAVRVPLPDSSYTSELVKPYAGAKSWYSGSASDLTNTLTRDVAPAASVNLSAQVWYDTEANYDFLSVQYSLDGGATWTTLKQYSGASKGWQSMKWSYKAGDKASQVRFVYKTDGGTNGKGVLLDDITLSVGKTSDTDGAESSTSLWQAKGWVQSDGTTTTTGSRYYLMENRSYAAFDDTLRTGPYNFTSAATKPDWVEHFPYQNGMLVWMIDHGVADNNTSTHNGTGYALPVDARPEVLKWSGGGIARQRIQSFDATFGLGATDPLSLHRELVSTVKKTTTVTPDTLTLGAQPAVPTFDDTLSYWSADNPRNSVKVAGVGVKATVTAQTDSSLTVDVVNP